MNIGQGDLELASHAVAKVFLAQGPQPLLSMAFFAKCAMFYEAIERIPPRVSRFFGEFRAVGKRMRVGGDTELAFRPGAFPRRGPANAVQLQTFGAISVRHEQPLPLLVYSPLP